MISLQVDDTKYHWYILLIIIHFVTCDVTLRLCGCMLQCSFWICAATAYGLGVYFAVDFSYSAQRSYSPPDPNGIKYVFQCRVLTGQFVDGTSGMKEPPQRPNTRFRYDSVTNSARDPKIFVIFKDTQAYPEYVISFRG